MKKDIFSNSIFLTLLILILFEPDCLKCIPWVDNTILILEGCVAILIAIRYVFFHKKNCLPILIIFFYVPMYIATIYYQQDIWFALKKTALCVTFSMLCEIEFRIKNKKFFDILGTTILCMCIVNIISFIPFPKGIVASGRITQDHKIYFISGKNGLISWTIIPIIIFYANYLDRRSNKDRNRLNLSIWVALGGLLYTGSTTGMIGFITCLLLMIGHKYPIIGRITIRKVLPISIILYVSVVVVRIQNYFLKLIEFIFRKSTGTLTGREMLWDQAIGFFRKSPVIGYGLREESIIVTGYGRHYLAHNFVLETLISGGLLSFFMYVVLIILTVRRCRDISYNTAITAFITGFLVFVVCTLTEGGIYDYKWWLILILLYHSGDYIKMDLKTL